MSKKIYIAGKVTGLPQTEVVAKFAAAQSIVENLGFEAVNPINVVNDFSATWKQAMKLCIGALMECNYILLLPCHIDSKGALLEKEIAESFDMIVITLD